MFPNRANIKTKFPSSCTAEMASNTLHWFGLAGDEEDLTDIGIEEYLLNCVCVARC